MGQVALDKLAVSGGSQQGLRPALEKAVVSNHRLFFSIAYTLLRNVHAAEDAVQSAIYKAFSRIDRIKNAESIVYWLAKVTRNTALDAMRKGGGTRMVPMDEALAANLAGADKPPRGDYDMLYDAVRSLPPAESVVVMLRYLEDLDIAQVAQRLGIQQGAARVRLHRGMKRLLNNPRLRKAYATS